jgi:hypothetical protein
VEAATHNVVEHHREAERKVVKVIISSQRPKKNAGR